MNEEIFVGGQSMLHNFALINVVCHFEEHDTRKHAKKCVELGECGVWERQWKFERDKGW